jgi:hypothetical protein
VEKNGVTFTASLTPAPPTLTLQTVISFMPKP